MGTGRFFPDFSVILSVARLTRGKGGIICRSSVILSGAKNPLANALSFWAERRIHFHITHLQPMDISPYGLNMTPIRHSERSEESIAHKLSFRSVLSCEESYFRSLATITTRDDKSATITTRDDNNNIVILS